MKKVVSMMMAVMLLLNVSFGYTLTVTYNGSQTVREVEGGRDVIVGLSSRDNANYTVDTGNAILEVHGNRRQFVMPEGNVGITITDIEEGVQEKTVLDMRVGDYVTYYPTETECDLTVLTGVEQEPLNPSKTIQWRVLSNDGENVELVSAESVGDLWLGWNANDDFENAFAGLPYGNRDIAKIHYANIVKILNDISESYVNSAVATEGRGLGWNGSSVEEINISTYPLTYASTSGNANFINGEPYSDSQYLETMNIMDCNAIINNGMLKSGEAVWLASRYCVVYPGVVNFIVFVLNDDGGYVLDEYGYGFVFDDEGGIVLGSTVTISEDESFSSSIAQYGIRPVVKLRNGIKVDGKGTEEEPYTLIEESKSIVVFENNGGKETYFKSVVNGSPYGELPKVTKDNYLLEGWCLDEALTSTITQIDVKDAGDITLYAKYSPVVYTIEYQTLGGTLSENAITSYTVEDSGIKLATASKQHYEFVAWCSDEQLQNAVTEIDLQSAGNITLYAKYSPISYKIEYVVGDGATNENAITSYTVEDGVINLLPASKKYYVFDGWYLDGEYSQAISEIDASKGGDITIYAKFTKEKEDIVDCNSFIGSSTATLGILALSVVTMFIYKKRGDRK